MRNTIKLLFFIACWTLSIPIPSPAYASSISFIRDAEIENIIALYSKPIFEAANLSADNVEIYLVNDSRLNAFVAGGQKLFIHTGLLQRSRTPEQVIGVIAHESGHIAGGHLSRLRQKMKGVPAESVIGFILGGAAALAGEAGAGAVIALGGQDAAQRSLLSYSRMEEGSADQAAIKYLDETQISSKGLLEFFQILKRDETRRTAEQNPYIRSHPLTAARISAMKSHVDQSPYSDNKLGPEYREMHARMRAKLDAFLLSPTHTMRLYPMGDTSIAARYARAAAYHKNDQMEQAIAEIDSLLQDRPNDPYFHELKGQIFFENGLLDQAVASYEKSVELLPGNPLLLLALGRSYLEQDDPQKRDKAISMLEATVNNDKDYAFAWRQLGIAYGKAGRMAESSLALAEEAFLRRRYKDAAFLSARAEKGLKVGSRQWIQAQDVRLTSERLLKKQKR
ncbi:M48 family metalloprotease [Terasakiella sp. A23]|uniref:M48 family metalloprotease n=1 Tax=Terasakiella sp. FCG-A23 TaxID=3080561 RepID=UPI002952AD52|nr:M48 family metalloprotease [Terasakiella sp. A23]MDV7339408.1 M48 family metalloprotease [Terasakiella sp. A23]